ncbi:MAG: DUF4870 domain-containing protein [Anaerolineales bacterium]|nr:DUF4870 domain-containing protein [Anaerolineales bacterium]
MSFDPEREERLAAALCHSAALMPLVGAAVPLAVFLSQRERSPFLRFQAAQALTYQILGLLAYFLIMACQFLVPFTMFPVAIFARAAAPDMVVNETLSPEGGILLALLILSMLVLLVIWGAFFIGGPFYIILAFVGAWRLLAGHDFRYLVLGNLVARWLNLDNASDVNNKE